MTAKKQRPHIEFEYSAVSDESIGGIVAFSYYAPIDDIKKLEQLINDDIVFL
jgi:hypothetical protein